MTNHWRDIRHADVIIINGANPAEAHPVGFQWFLKAKLDPKRGIGNGGGAKMIHIDPRFTRTSAVSDVYARIRTGTDTAFFGGLINYVLEKNLIHHDYVRHYTNASFLVKEGFGFDEGLFSGYDPVKRTYDTSTWAYEGDAPAQAAFERTQKEIAAARPGPGRRRARGWRWPSATCSSSTRARCSSSCASTTRATRRRWSPRSRASRAEQFLEIAKIVGETGRPDKVMTVVYAVGLTHHTTGGQLIRTAAILQLLLGNMGRPGGGMNAERGHANIQGNTDNAISWEILPGYLRIPAPGQKNLDDYVTQSAPKKFDANSWNFFGTNYRKFMVSLLKAWYGDAATKDNEYAFDFIPKPATNSSWISIYDQALKKKMEGVILSGMTATSIGPDANQVMQALANLKWLAVMDPLPTTSSEFWRRPGADPKSIQTEVFMIPTTHWIEKDGSFVNSGRWMQWKEAAIPPEGARHDHWILAEVFQRVKKLYAQQGGKFPAPLMAADDELQGSAQAGAGRDLPGDQRLRPDHGQAARHLRQAQGRRHDHRRQLDLHRLLSRGRQPVQAPRRHPGPEEERSDRHGLLPRLGVELAAQPARHVQPRLRGPRRQAVGSVAARASQWDEAEKKWKGDVPDYPATMEPRSPKAWGPFIMNGEGVGRLFSSSMLDGPFPEHYEPVESPVENPLHPKQSESPVVFLYDKQGGRENRFGTAKDYPYIATSYRLTEHEHYVTQHVPALVGLQPSPFVEMPEEVAKEKGIETGDRVRVTSKRGKLEVLAVVTKRLGGLEVNGKTVYHIGIPIHWGFVGHRGGPGSDQGRQLARQRADAVRGRRQLADAGVQGVPGQHREDLMARLAVASTALEAWARRRRRARQLLERHAFAGADPAALLGAARRAGARVPARRCDDRPEPAGAGRATWPTT